MEKSLVTTELFNKKPDSQIMRHRDGHRPVSFLTENEVYLLTDAARTMGKHGLRNETMIFTLFQSALRVSEGLDLRLRDRQIREGSYLLIVENGKGGKPRLCGIPESLYHRIGSYASAAGIIRPEDKLFDISRVRAWQILQTAAEKAGLDHKRIYNHLLRHTGAVQRLRKTGDIGSLRVFLGHNSTEMSLRYLTTVQQIESVKVESKVNFER